MSYRPPMSGKGSSPRVAMRARLRLVKALISSQISDFDRHSGKVYVPMDERAPGDPYLRDRREGEFLEEMPDAWRKMAVDYDFLATFFMNEARNMRNIADTIERTGACPRIPNTTKKRKSS